MLYSRAQLRTFETETWEEIERKLALWKHNTSDVLQVVHNAGLNFIKAAGGMVPQEPSGNN